MKQKTLALRTTLAFETLHEATIHGHKDTKKSSQVKRVHEIIAVTVHTVSSQ
jgi:hypothetical protein